MTKTKILLVEDDVTLGVLIKDTLELYDFNVEHSLNGADAIEKFNSLSFDICILDIMLPDTDGYSLCLTMKKINAGIPILFLSAKSQQVDVLKGFEVGGSDYLKKPFNISELIARIKILTNLENYFHEKITEIEIGNAVFNNRTQEISYKNTTFKFTHKESKLLNLLASQRNEIVSKTILLNEIWGEVSPANARNLDVLVAKLRSQLKKINGISILNSKGVGYMLISN